MAMTTFTDVKEFPQIYNETSRATLGVARSFQIIKDSEILYLDSVDELGTLGIYSAKIKNDTFCEVLLVDPRNIVDADEEIPEALKTLKERLRDTSIGINSYQYSSEKNIIIFSLSNKIYIFSMDQNKVIKIIEDGFLPLLSPNGKYIAICVGTTLKIYSIVEDCYIKTVEREGYIWAQPDFVSAEEMGRYISVWFSPDSSRVISLGFNDNEVSKTQIQNTQDEEPRDYKYPFAGTTNPKLLLNDFEIYKSDTFKEIKDEYYVNTHFKKNKPISITLNRKQDKISGNGVVIYSSDSHIDLFNTIPKPIDDDKWLNYDVDANLDLKHLTVGDIKILGTDGLLNVYGFSKNHFYFQIMVEGTSYQVKRISIHDLENSNSVLNDCTKTIKKSESPIAITISKESDSYMLNLKDSETIFPTILFCREMSGKSSTVKFGKEAEYDINFDVTTTIKTINNDIRVSISKQNTESTEPSPLLIYSYGGPSGFTSGNLSRYAISAKQRSLTQQWFASLGFIVVSIDGAGMSVGSVSREHETRQGFYEPTTRDQIIAIEEIIETENIDNEKIAIMGWSFGGYLAGACISKRPDIFKVAIIGAPVTDWKLYDTCYTERYLGNPTIEDAPYSESSLLNKSFSKDSHIKLIHGRNDDNVLYVNSLKLARHLNEQNVNLEFITLDNSTHMVADKQKAAKLLIDDAIYLGEKLCLPKIKELLN